MVRGDDGFQSRFRVYPNLAGGMELSGINFLLKANDFRSHSGRLPSETLCR
jgi:hypothetical protein